MNEALGIPNEAFFLVDNTVLSVLGQVSFMPTLALAVCSVKFDLNYRSIISVFIPQASLCPPGIEGTLFASLMSIYNAGGLVSSELGG